MTRTTLIKTFDENTEVNIQIQYQPWSVCSVGVIVGLTPGAGTLVPLQSTQTATTARGDDRGSIVQRLLMLLSHSQKQKET